MKLAIIAAAALCAATATTAARAADFVLTVGPGTSSTDFGNSGVTSGIIDDRYFFEVPAGIANGLIGSIALTPALDVNFTRITLNDKPFDRILGDGTELQTLSWTSLAAGAQVIRVQGSWGSEGGSYAGTLNFAPAAAVPEPGSWALAIAGIAVTGGAMRRRRHGRPAAALA